MPTANTASYPDINGIQYDWSSIEISTGGIPTLGFKSIDYKSSLEPGEKRTNNSSRLVGRTRGVAKDEASFELYKVEADALIKRLGPAYKEKSFNINVSYSDTGQPTITDYIYGARIKSVSNSPKEGSETPTVKFELSVMEVRESGVAGTKDSLFGG
jgi:hypothetical protein